MGWHEWLWVGIHKGVEVQEVKLWIKIQRVLYVCVNDEKSRNIEPNDIKNIYFLIRKVLKNWTKWNKKSIFNLLLSLMWHLRIFKFSLDKMRHLAKLYDFSHEISTFIYIYIYIYIIFVLYRLFLFLYYAWNSNLKHPLYFDYSLLYAWYFYD